jgi:NADH:ubiquinone oxidoreductase subunit C
MTDEELESEWTKAAERFEKAKAECKAFSDEMQIRAADKSARDKLEAMSDDERAAMAQLISAGGIESQEGTGDL